MRRGELAIRARQRQRRAVGRKAQTLDEAVSNRMDEGLARLEADRMTKPPSGLTKAAGEVVDLGDLGFITGYLADTLENPNMISVDASEQRMHLAARAGVLQAAVDAAESARAGNSLEKMLCHQMAAAHFAAMKLISYSFDQAYAPGERARVMNSAARIMQVYQEGLLVLQKLRTGGRQTFLVQHVQVSEGGQAVITGSMKSGTGARNGSEEMGGKNEGYTP
jgi:hypothetical protein